MRDVSVIVCTHRPERWPLLLDCLASLGRQSLQPLEVIVVVDGRPDILKRLEQRGGAEIAVSTPAPSGLSVARNVGLAHASGAFVAFLDDDAVAEESWLEVLRTVLEDETVAGASGVSVPVWVGRRPRWMPDELLWALGCSYRGMPATQADVRNVYGGCACFRADVFTRFGGFNANLGRMAAGLAGCEETELCLRVRRQSPMLRFVHEPAAIICHHVPRDRQRASYVFSRSRGEGRSKAQLRAVSSGGGRPFAREVGYLATTVPKGVLSGVAEFFRGDMSGLVRATVLIIAVLNTVAAYAATRVRGLPGYVAGKSAASDPGRVTASSQNTLAKVDGSAE